MRLLAVTAGVLAVAGAACDGRSLLAPSGTAMALFASSPTAGGETQITAVLIEDGTQTSTGPNPSTIVVVGTGTPVHDGTLVHFFTTVGRVEPTEMKTTEGKATVRLIADGQTGTAVVTAISGPATNTLKIDVNTGAVQ